MTTDQTIDGVPRKSLEQALKMAAVFDDGGDGADAESARGVVWILRALLDAPASEAGKSDIASALESSDWAGTSIGNKVLVAAAITELRKAAQPQGEPVAWRFVAAINGKHYITEETPDQQQKRIDNSEPGHYLFASEPLYLGPSEQPAPVAVDVLITGFHTTESGGGKYAINIGFRSMADMQAADAQLRELLKSR